MPPGALNGAPDGLPRAGVGGSPAGGRQMWWKDQSPGQTVDGEAWVMGSGDSWEAIQGSFRAVGAEAPARTCPCWGRQRLRGAALLPTAPHRPASASSQHGGVHRAPPWVSLGWMPGASRERLCPTAVHQPHGALEFLIGGFVQMRK